MSSDIRLSVKYFAWLRERIGVAGEEFGLPHGVITIGDFIDWLIAQDEKYKHAFEHREFIKIAVDLNQVDDNFALTKDHEIAFFPPMTGG